jgi:hypothetical protein
MSSAPAKKENLLLNLVCTIAVPSLILSKLSAPERLGPELGLVVALLFPLGYGAWDFAQRRKFNFVAGIGFASTLLTGGFALAKADGIWFAIKEASVPAVIGLMVLLSTKSKRPLIREFIFNDQVIDIARVDAALEAHGARQSFEKLLAVAGRRVTASFFLSAILNFLLARWFLTAPAGSREFNQQLGNMNVWSWAVIVIPSTGMMMWALWGLLAGVKSLTGLSLEEIMHSPEKPASPPAG